jgi:hypothetical protein
MNQERTIPRHDGASQQGKAVANDPRLGRTVKLLEYPQYTFTVTNVWHWNDGLETLAIDCVQYPTIGFDVPVTAIAFVEQKNAACATNTEQH